MTLISIQWNVKYIANKTWLSVLIIIALAIVGLLLGNMAIFNAWQTAFPSNEPYLGILKTRFWLYGFLSLACIVLAITLSVLTVKRINKTYREKNEGIANEKGN